VQVRVCMQTDKHICTACFPAHRSVGHLVRKPIIIINAMGIGAVYSIDTIKNKLGKLKAA